ncbi:helix-turn-helix transcriptional regulator [Sporosarcina thermotolerans]|uniref:Helix-turn-helix transcriptional regulator n=2 Tax=Sporosarcina thermotolerans TaxID=633404 RepID=A0AAW9AA78_9BACL|nr:helix-turn-helix transcriptional regulator [Sporosarcina thermotolerans]MDW0118377.1 helix-turn-helix transcriptional regulator [Sporosarcina thermotolerans]WHT49883.1 helix-turn-helix transcriptional regulator [Sporosarcina thermotolerans]
MKNQIKDMRTEMGLTQDDLAEKLEVSRQTIISLEKGRYNPSLILAFKIAKLFNCTIEDIFQPEEE